MFMQGHRATEYLDYVNFLLYIWDAPKAPCFFNDFARVHRHANRFLPFNMQKYSLIASLPIPAITLRRRH